MFFSLLALAGRDALGYRGAAAADRGGELCAVYHPGTAFHAPFPNTRAVTLSPPTNPAGQFRTKFSHERGFRGFQDTPMPGRRGKWTDGDWHPVAVAEACALLRRMLSETIDFQHAVPQAHAHDVQALAREIVAPVFEPADGPTDCATRASEAVAFVAHDLSYSYSHTALAFLAADRANLVLVVASDMEG